MSGFSYAIGKYTFLKHTFELGDWFSSIQLGFLSIHYRFPSIQLGFPSIHCWFSTTRVTFSSIRLEKDTIPTQKDTPITKVEFDRLVPLEEAARFSFSYVCRMIFRTCLYVSHLRNFFILLLYPYNLSTAYVMWLYLL
jgi:hypothetical protein